VRSGLAECENAPVTGRVASINVSSGGVPKAAVAEAVVSEYGLDGDYQNDPAHHGGPSRAVSLYSLELIEALRAEGHPIAAGTAGENITIAGLDWPSLRFGQELLIGGVRLRITGYAAPCEKIRASFLDGDFVRISHKVHAGWSRLYTRVLSGGVVRVNDAVSLPFP
jgi:MOSC domain-containing protein YiiM